ncbi:MAG TPA: ketoacyl-ACP synthase III [Sorangium sp.]|nr:ketoacyl-ACP synthase III [Sorangium sp.]
MLYIHGLGHFHPPNIIDNRFLESLEIGTTNDWIVSRVGIEQRRTVLPLEYIRTTKNCCLAAAQEAAEYNNAQCGARAAKMALARAGVPASDIGLVVAGGCSPQWCTPAEASVIARELEMEVPAFDLQAACSTFGAQLHWLAKMGAGLPDYVLTVMVENNTRVIDYRDRSSCVLWGDGAAAAVVSTKHVGRLRVLQSTFGGAPSGALEVVVQRTGFFSQNGTKVQKFAIKRMVQLFRECQQGVAEGARDEVVYVGHQANLTMLRSVARRCEVAGEQHWFNIDRFGNQGAAGAPIVVSQRYDELEKGQHIGAVVVGAGLSWSGVLLEVVGP